MSIAKILGHGFSHIYKPTDGGVHKQRVRQGHILFGNVIFTSLVSFQELKEKVEKMMKDNAK